MIQDPSEANEGAERVGEVEQEAGASPLVVAARDVSAFPILKPRSLVRPYDWKRTT